MNGIRKFAGVDKPIACPNKLQLAVGDFPSEELSGLQVGLFVDKSLDPPELLSGVESLSGGEISGDGEGGTEGEMQTEISSEIPGPPAQLGKTPPAVDAEIEPGGA